MDRDWGGLRKNSFMVRLRMFMYPAGAYGVEEGGVRRGAEGTRDVGSE